MVNWLDVMTIIILMFPFVWITFSTFVPTKDKRFYMKLYVLEKSEEGFLSFYYRMMSTQLREKELKRVSNQYRYISYIKTILGSVAVALFMKADAKALVEIREIAENFFVVLSTMWLFVAIVFVGRMLKRGKQAPIYLVALVIAVSLFFTPFKHIDTFVYSMIFVLFVGFYQFVLKLIELDIRMQYKCINQEMFKAYWRKTGEVIQTKLTRKGIEETKAASIYQLPNLIEKVTIYEDELEE
ncbi:hypothetical protein V4S29_10515 [Enterococcus cecorum]|uniref:hypothetical protein n=2 Tax=Enterococcus cecorum TaxID=44008 RepID=UPI003264EF84